MDTKIYLRVRLVNPIEPESLRSFGLFGRGYEPRLDRFVVRAVFRIAGVLDGRNSISFSK
jgi:hypothetical protein